MQDPGQIRAFWIQGAPGEAGKLEAGSSVPANPSSGSTPRVELTKARLAVAPPAG